MQDCHDPVAAEAVNDLEDLTNGLASRIWQKIVIIQAQESGSPLSGGDRRPPPRSASDSLATPGAIAGKDRASPSAPGA